MKKAKEKKPREIPWSFAATAACSVAIRELKRVKEQQAILSKKSKLLQEIIICEGGGKAHGIRAALRHQKGGTRWRQVTTKERDFVVFLKD